MQLLFLAICILCWGVTYFLEKLAVDKIGAYNVQIFYGLFLGALSVPLLLTNSSNANFSVDRRYIAVILIASLTAMLGNIAFFLSIKGNSNSAGYTISSNAYAIIVIVLANIFLKETISGYKLLGILLIVVGNVLILLKM